MRRTVSRGRACAGNRIYNIEIPADYEIDGSDDRDAGQPTPYQSYQYATMSQRHWDDDAASYIAGQRSRRKEYISRYHSRDSGRRSVDATAPPSIYSDAVHHDASKSGPRQFIRALSGRERPRAYSGSSDSAEERRKLRRRFTRSSQDSPKLASRSKSTKKRPLPAVPDPPARPLHSEPRSQEPTLQSFGDEDPAEIVVQVMHTEDEAAGEAPGHMSDREYCSLWGHPSEEGKGRSRRRRRRQSVPYETENEINARRRHSPSDFDRSPPYSWAHHLTSRPIHRSASHNHGRSVSGSSAQSLFQAPTISRSTSLYEPPRRMTHPPITDVTNGARLPLVTGRSMESPTDYERPAPPLLPLEPPYNYKIPSQRNSDIMSSSVRPKRSSSRPPTSGALANFLNLQAPRALRDLGRSSSRHSRESSREPRTSSQEPRRSSRRSRASSHDHGSSSRHLTESPREHERSSRSEPKQRAPQKVECVACMSEKDPKRAPKLHCGHRMCRSCLRQLFELSMTDVTQMPPKCCSAIPLEHVADLFDEAFKRRFKRKLKERTTPDKVYCPSVGCGHWIRPSYISEEKGREIAVCSKCQTKVCVACKGKWHKSSKCPRDEQTREILKVAKDEGWQRCYKCKAIVELKEGCNHMVCHCKAEFCMKCGKKWKICGCPWFNYGPEEDMPGGMEGPQAPQDFQAEMMRRRQQEEMDLDFARQIQLEGEVRPEPRRQHREDPFGFDNRQGYHDPPIRRARPGDGTDNVPPRQAGDLGPAWNGMGRVVRMGSEAHRQMHEDQGWRREEEGERGRVGRDRPQWHY